MVRWNKVGIKDSWLQGLSFKVQKLNMFYVNTHLGEKVGEAKLNAVRLRPWTIEIMLEA